jgi:hypothetical protein
MNKINKNCHYHPIEILIVILILIVIDCPRKDYDYDYDYDYERKFNNHNLVNDSKTPANTGYCARETVPMG